MNVPKPVSYALRLAITALAAYLAFSHVNLQQIWPILHSIPVPLLIAALVMTHIGQVISALRTRYYLHCQQIDFPAEAALRLHYVGGLFGVFLPGGAGGDAYKAWWLKRHKQGKLFNMMKLMIAARLNGLWTLGLFVCLLAFFSAPVRHLVPYASAMMLATALAGTVFYGALAKYVLKEPLKQQLHASVYSFGVQAMLMGIAYVICIGLGAQGNALEYVIMFMLSCILAMLPISIGGIGVRELALLQGSRMLSLSEETGVTLAFTFTILSLTIPLVGAIIHNFAAPEGDKVAAA